MNLNDFKKINLPDGPGVYFFKKSEKNSDSETLYIGKATSLRDRVRSYFNDDLIQTRGRLLVDMVAQAESISFQETDSVLEAFILESELIKKYLPRYNTKEKDNKSFNYVIITKEDFPRVLVVRGRNLEKAGPTKKEQIDNLGFEYIDVFGPFPFGAELREAMKLIRRIFPFRDKCQPYNGAVKKGLTMSDGARIINASEKNKPCFNRSIGLCPGVCTGEISKEDYAKQIQNLRLFFKGKKQAVVNDLKIRMMDYAQHQKFEEAGEIKRTLNSLAHIHDISMIKKDAQFGHIGKRVSGSRSVRTGSNNSHIDSTNVDGSVERVKNNTEKYNDFVVRAEAYDIAHMSGKDMVGVMVVMEDGDFVKEEYKKFNIKEIQASNDTGALRQVLERRFAHTDWYFPTHIVLDGGVAQMNVAESVLNSLGEKGKSIQLVSVLKDETHKAKSILKSTQFPGTHFDKDTIFDDGDIISMNQECHRFAIATHRKRRSLSRGL